MNELQKMSVDMERKHFGKEAPLSREHQKRPLLLITPLVFLCWVILAGTGIGSTEASSNKETGGQSQTTPRFAPGEILVKFNEKFLYPNINSLMQEGLLGPRGMTENFNMRKARFIELDARRVSLGNLAKDTIEKLAKETQKNFNEDLKKVIGKLYKKIPIGDPILPQVMILPKRTLVLSGTEVLNVQPGKPKFEGLELEKILPQWFLQEELVDTLGKILEELDNKVVDYAVPNATIESHNHNTSPPNEYFWLDAGHQTVPLQNTWDLELIGIAEAWKDTTGSQKITVAVLDGGIDVDHPDLEDNLWPNFAEQGGDPEEDDDGNGYIDDIHGVNFTHWLTGTDTVCDAVLPETDLNDEDGHGTQMSGVIGAIGNNQMPDNLGTMEREDHPTGSVGVNWSVHIMPLKISCRRAIDFPDLTSKSWTDMACSAIEYAVMNGAHIINGSWGTFPCRVGDGCTIAQRNRLINAGKVFDTAIGIAREAGVLYVASAGNGTGDIDRDGGDDSAEGIRGVGPIYPANIESSNLIAVSAVQPALDNAAGEVMRPDSNFGSNGSVHIAAPGFSHKTTRPGDNHTPWHGKAGGKTSGAAAFVSGCAALMQNWRLELGLPLLSPEQLKTRLITSGAQPKQDGKNLYSTVIDEEWRNLVVDGRRLDCHEALHKAIDVCGGC